MLRNALHIITMPLIFILSGCYPHIGPDGNAAIPLPSSIQNKNDKAFDTSAYINQCYEKGFYDKETHNDMLKGLTSLQAKQTGKKLLTSPLEQPADYQGCEFFIMNFDNYDLIPHLDSKGRVRETIKPTK